jgi:formylglycine-generating enzyme required for sulfatase activity
VLNQGEIFAGRYRIEGTLGQGGMGTAYRALDQLAQEMVALKLIDPALAGEQLLVDKFKQELALARRITHPNVVRIYDLGESDSVLFISMELVEGRTLADELRLNGPIPSARLQPMVGQILDAMREIHARRVLHRDMKPANVMLTPAGVVKVMDFGIARDLGSDRTIGLFAFTPGYSAPEVVTGTGVNFTSDIYSIGAMTYELLVGRKPGLPLDDRELPAEWRPLISACLQADPAARPQSIDAAARWLPGGGAASPSRTPAPEVPRQTSAEPDDEPKKIGTPALVGMVAAAVMAVALIAYFVLQPAPPSTAVRTAPASEGIAEVTALPASLPDVVQGEGGTMALIPAGTFLMGNSEGVLTSNGYRNEAPTHTVDVKDFYLDQNEVSVQRLSDFVARGGSTWKANGAKPSAPAYGVPWDLAVGFCKSLGKRLPTEEEWEKAAADSRHLPVEAPLEVDNDADQNRYGLRNMTSNVIEWVSDEYRLYPGNPAELPEQERGKRVFRGFGYQFQPAGLNPRTIRGALHPLQTKPPVGFRCAADPAAVVPRK